MQHEYDTVEAAARRPRVRRRCLCVRCGGRQEQGVDVVFEKPHHPPTSAVNTHAHTHAHARTREDEGAKLGKQGAKKSVFMFFFGFWFLVFSFFGHVACCLAHTHTHPHAALLAVYYDTVARVKAQSSGGFKVSMCLQHSLFVSLCFSSSPNCARRIRI